MIFWIVGAKQRILRNLGQELINLRDCHLQLIDLPILCSKLIFLLCFDAWGRPWSARGLPLGSLRDHVGYHEVSVTRTLALS